MNDGSDAIFAKLCNVAKQCMQSTILNLSSMDYGVNFGGGNGLFVVRRSKPNTVGEAASKNWNWSFRQCTKAGEGTVRSRTHIVENGGEVIRSEAKVVIEQDEGSLVRDQGGQPKADHCGRHHSTVESNQQALHVLEQALDANFLLLKADDLVLGNEQNIVILVGGRSDEFPKSKHLRLQGPDQAIHATELVNDILLALAIATGDNGNRTRAAKSTRPRPTTSTAKATRRSAST